MQINPRTHGVTVPSRLYVSTQTADARFSIGPRTGPQTGRRRDARLVTWLAIAN